MNILITVALFAIFAKWTAASTVDEPSSSEGVDMREIEGINLDIFPGSANRIVFFVRGPSGKSSKQRVQDISSV